MHAMAVRCLNRRKYLSNFLAGGIRTDGRTPDAPRPVSLNVGSITSADGSALTRFGDTVVICGIKLELVASLGDRGHVVCNVECGSNCSPEATSSAPSSQVQALTKQLQLLLDKYVVLEQLVVEGNSQFVWTVFVDIVCLSHHGNLLDTCTLATVAALQNTKIPSLSMDSNSLRLDHSSTTNLPLKRPFFMVSFSLLDDWCLLDPVLEEERNAQGHIWFSITDDGKIVQFQHSGHKITGQDMLRLSQLAMNRVSSFNKLLLRSQQQ